MKKDSSSKDTRKENKKANQSFLNYVFFLYYFSAVYILKNILETEQRRLP